MADEDLRELERRWKQTGDDDDKRAFERARARSGQKQDIPPGLPGSACGSCGGTLTDDDPQAPPVASVNYDDYDWVDSGFTARCMGCGIKVRGSERRAWITANKNEYGHPGNPHGIKEGCTWIFSRQSDGSMKLLQRPDPAKLAEPYESVMDMMARYRREEREREANPPEPARPAARSRPTETPPSVGQSILSWLRSVFPGGRSS